MKTSFPFLLPFVGALTFAAVASGANNGTDNATASAYSDDWQSGDNGAVSGSAFGAWSLTNPGGSNSGFFIGSSTNNGAVNPSIDTGGKAFGMYGVNAEADAYRNFSSNLDVGQTFSADMTVNYRNGYKGIDLRDASGTTIFNFNTTNDDYVVNVASFPGAGANGSIGNAYSSDTEFHLSFTQTSTSGGTWSITRTGGVSDFDTGTYSGIADGFKLYVDSTDGTPGSNDLYTNNFSIVPEPSTYVIGLLMAGVAGVRFLQARRRLA